MMEVNLSETPAAELLSPKQLGIPAAHRGALVKTLELMEAGRIKHYKLKHVKILTPLAHPRLPFTGQFNMATWRTEVTCDTVACIGGTTELVGNVVFGYIETPDALDNLFYPDVSVQLEDITVKEAAAALRNYLTIGKSNWPQVLHDSRGCAL